LRPMPGRNPFSNGNLRVGQLASWPLFWQSGQVTAALAGSFSVGTAAITARRREPPGRLRSVPGARAAWLCARPRWMPALSDQVHQPVIQAQAFEARPDEIHAVVLRRRIDLPA